jgi:hypothetical protein
MRDGVATSKKEPSKRRAELLKKLLPQLAAVVAVDAKTLLTSLAGCHVVQETLMAGYSGVNANANADADAEADGNVAPEWLEGTVAAVADACAGGGDDADDDVDAAMDNGDDDADALPLYEQLIPHHCMRRLLDGMQPSSAAAGKAAAAAAMPTFAAALFARIAATDDDNDADAAATLTAWASTNRGAFVLHSLLQALTAIDGDGGGGAAASLKSQLTAVVKALPAEATKKSGGAVLAHALGLGPAPPKRASKANDDAAMPPPQAGKKKKKAVLKTPKKKSNAPPMFGGGGDGDGDGDEEKKEHSPALTRSQMKAKKAKK